VMLAESLERRGIPRAVVAAGTIVDIVSCYAAYALCLGLALVATTLRDQCTALILWSASVFIFFGVAFSVTLLALSSRALGNLAHKLRRVGPLVRALRFLEDADLPLLRSPRLLVEASAWQIGILLLDSLTIWAL